MKLSMKFAVLVFVILVLYGRVLVWQLASIQEPEIDKPEKSRIVATQDLQAFTLLTYNNIEPRTESDVVDHTTPNINDFTDRYLLVNVQHGAELKEEMIAPKDAKDLLSDAVTVSIPVTATTFLGGQLRARDIVDLIATKGGTGAKKFENLIVLNIVQANKETNLPTTIVLAVPRAQRDDFAAAVVSAELLVTRKIVATNP